VKSVSPSLDPQAHTARVPGIEDSHLQGLGLDLVIDNELELAVALLDRRTAWGNRWSVLIPARKSLPFEARLSCRMPGSIRGHEASGCPPPTAPQPEMLLQRLLPSILFVCASCVVAPPPAPSQPVPAQSPDPGFVPPEGLVVPQGTTLMIRMYDSVNTRQHRAGHRFTAVLEADLVAEGQTLAPRGSLVYGVVRQAQSAGRAVGRSSMTLQPTEILIGSRMYPLTSGAIQAVAAQSSGARTVGRTARAAAIGGLVNGSKGAKNGAKVGLGASLLSDDGQIQVASGTLLQFTLTAPLAP